MAEYTLETRPGSPGYVFATRADGQLFEVYLQYGAVEPRIADATERAALVALCRAYRPPTPPAPAPRDTSHDIPDVRPQMRRAGFDVDDGHGLAGAEALAQYVEGLPRLSESELDHQDWLAMAASIGYTHSQRGGTMTPTELRTLARVLGALLPSRVIDPSGGDPEAAGILAERLDAGLEKAGIEPPAVAIISDSLVSFLLGWGTRYDNLGDEVERGVGVLSLAVTGDPQLLPGGATLEDDHSAQLLSWALLVDLEEEAP